MKFVGSPNLPSADVGLAAVSATYPEIACSLARLGVRCVLTGPGRGLDGPVRCHADMLCFHAGGARMVVAKGETALAGKFGRYGFQVAESSRPVRSPYPYEAGLNAAKIGGWLIDDPRFLDEAVLRSCGKAEVIPVRQGYARCSCAVVDENSLITADSGIAGAALSAGMDVLKIEPGGVALPGFQYGFIGGACGKIGKDALAFAGRIQDHENFTQIREFLRLRGIGIVTLSDGPLTDVGGILPLMEY